MGASSSRRLGWERKTSLAVTQRFRISASVSSTFFPGALCFFPSSSRRISSSTALPSITYARRRITPTRRRRSSRPLVRPDRRPLALLGRGGDADEWCARRDGRGKTRGPRVSCCLPRPPFYAAQTLGPRRLAKSGRVAAWQREEWVAGEAGGRSKCESPPPASQRDCGSTCFFPADFFFDIAQTRGIFLLDGSAASSKLIRHASQGTMQQRHVSRLNV